VSAEKNYFIFLRSIERHVMQIAGQTVHRTDHNGKFSGGEGLLMRDTSVGEICNEFLRIRQLQLQVKS